MGVVLRRSSTEGILTSGTGTVGVGTVGISTLGVEFVVLELNLGTLTSLATTLWLRKIFPLYHHS